MLKYIYIYASFISISSIYLLEACEFLTGRRDPQKELSNNG